MQVPETGPEAIEHYLANLDLEALEKEQKDVIKSKKKTARGRAVKILNALDGFKRTGAKPQDLMVKTVPVIPPQFRPFSAAGSTFIPGDANELYKDLLEYKRLYGETAEVLGHRGAGEAYKDMNKAVRAVYGFDDSPNPKTKSRAVKGFFKHVTGTNPKTSMFQAKMLSKTVDNVSRGVIVPDAEYDMNEVGLPKKMAWKMYGNYIQRRLVSGGMSPAAALKHLKEQSPQAQKALEEETKVRPVIVSRAPSWHKYNVVGQHPRLIDGDAVRINTWITDGLNADFDGDTVTVHVPASDSAVKETYEKLMPDKMLWSIRDMDTVVPKPKHEQILGLYNAATGKPKAVHNFSSKQEAMDAINRGDVSLSDEITINGIK